MRALAYLLGARALDVARDTGSRRTVPEVPMGPLATTDESASSWRHWATAHETPAAEAPQRLRQAPMPSQPKPTPI